MMKRDDGAALAVPLNRIARLHTMLWIRAVCGQALQSVTVKQKADERLHWSVRKLYLLHPPLPNPRDI